MAKTEFRSEINQSQTVRWLYYLARVRAVQLDYAAANRYLSLCIRRAPKDAAAPGFIQAVSVPSPDACVAGRLTNRYTNYTLWSSY